MQQGFVYGRPRLLLRIKGLAYAALALIGYAYSGYSWWLFAALILVPDVSMLGYLINPSFGAAIYNLVHTLTFPILLLFGAALFANMLLLASARSGSFILGLIAHSATGSNTKRASVIHIWVILAEASRKHRDARRLNLARLALSVAMLTDQI
jgi:hypothetical protein